MAQAMGRLFHDPALRAEMRRRALANAADRSWPQVLDDLWNRQDHNSRDAAIADLGRTTRRRESTEISAGVA